MTLSEILPRELFATLSMHLPESLRDIRLFVAVYEERSFTAAAARENATQSGVSQHISKLELLLNTKLFTRTAGAILPTPAGETFYQGCIELIRTFEKMRRNLEPFEGGLDGEVNLGITPTMARCVLAPALRRFVDSHPNVVVRVVEAYSGIISEQVRSGDIDFAIVPAMSAEFGLRSRLVGRTPELLVASRATGDRLRDCADLSAIGPVKLILPSRAHARRAHLDGYFRATDFKIERQLEMDSMFGTLEFVATTDWVTILPNIMMSCASDIDRFMIVPLVSPRLNLDLFRIESHRSTLTSAGEALFAALQEEINRVSAATPHAGSAF